MADIKQAAKWMREGKRVRRNGWHHCYREERGQIVDDGLGHTDYQGYEIDTCTSDLLADDWEIADD